MMVDFEGHHHRHMDSAQLLIINTHRKSDYLKVQTNDNEKRDSFFR